jgi:steroid delta-isomerase-like uncharacterized protein
MSLEANKALIRGHYEELNNKGNLDAADIQCSPDLIDHSSPPGTPRGPMASKLAVFALRSAFPDHHLEIEDMLAEGNKVVARCTWYGTHLGTFRGIQATGKKIAMQGIVIWRIADGKIAERWATVDFLGLMRQLGVLPEGAMK